MKVKEALIVYSPLLYLESRRPDSKNSFTGHITSKNCLTSLIFSCKMGMVTMSLQGLVLSGLHTAFRWVCKRFPFSIAALSFAAIQCFTPYLYAFSLQNSIFHFSLFSLSLSFSFPDLFHRVCNILLFYFSPWLYDHYLKVVNERS